MVYCVALWALSTPEGGEGGGGGEAQVPEGSKGSSTSNSLVIFSQEAFLGPQAGSGIHQVFENPISNSFCLQYSCHFPLHFQRTGKMEMQTTYVPIPGMRPRPDQEKH